MLNNITLTDVPLAHRPPGPRAMGPPPSRPSILLMGDTLGLGGTEGQFVELASRLDRSRWTVHVTCLRAEGPLRDKLEASGVCAWSCGRGSLKSVGLLRCVWALVRYMRRERIGLVHSFDFYSNVVGVLAARLAGVPAVIASQRDLGDLRPRPQARVHSLMLRLADRVLVNSEAVAGRLRRHRALAGRIVVIPNGVDLVRFSPAPGSTRRAAGITVGTLANLRPEKGLADLVSAAALVREACGGLRLVIWGEGALRRDLERQIRELGLDGTVELPGSTTDPEGALRRLDIFVLPSLSEACSNGLLEAIATGLPIVATSVGGNASLVEDAVTGFLVPPADPAALAKAIIRLIQDPALATELATRGRERLRASFGIDRTVARIETLYNEALTESAA
jgi:glycosyltransferase involved in cell wall biosynthesis